jgi:CBS domain-containing membrane protein
LTAEGERHGVHERLVDKLGFLQTPPEMAVLMVGVAILTVVGWLINRAAGIPVPLWAA